MNALYQVVFTDNLVLVRLGIYIGIGLVESRLNLRDQGFVFRCIAKESFYNIYT